MTGTSSIFQCRGRLARVCEICAIFLLVFGVVGDVMSAPLVAAGLGMAVIAIVLGLRGWLAERRESRAAHGDATHAHAGASSR